MEFLDEDTRPRFLFQSGGAANTPSATNTEPYNKPSKPLLFITLSLSSLLLALSIFFLQSEPFKSLLIWLSLSLFLGPFAPPSLTAGDIRVGLGPIVNFPVPEPESDDRRHQPRRSKSRRSDEPAVIPAASANDGSASHREAKNNRINGNGNDVTAVEEKEWTEEDIEILKKQMAKNPVGKPGRWEAIAAAFGGRHKAESVIKKSKELGEKKVDDSESYAQFLKKRKPMDKRAENNEGGDLNGGESVWSSGEDIALLNALKAFPKEASMRWEKVAAAVPGKSKASCMKRFAELKKGFRSAKAGVDGENKKD